MEFDRGNDERIDTVLRGDGVHAREEEGSNKPGWSALELAEEVAGERTRVGEGFAAAVAAQESLVLSVSRRRTRREIEIGLRESTRESVEVTCMGERRGDQCR